MSILANPNPSPGNTPRDWKEILALVLLVIFPLALNIWINIPELFRRAPYEDWDEICSYNHTRPMEQRSFRRVLS